MGLFNRAIDWMASQVQNATGETERRQLVAKIKQCAEKFKEKISQAIDALNAIIREFNIAVKQLNTARVSDVKSNIGKLFLFLDKFGNCKKAGEYSEEGGKLPSEFPRKDFDDISRYISGIDWSKDDVFWKTLLLSPLGMKLTTRQQNLSMQEYAHELEMQMEAKLQEIEQRKLSTQYECEVCKLYTQNVEFISTFIQKKILPELELVEAFFQAEKIKNEILGDQRLADIHFSYDVTTIVGTPYENHYRFVRNAFLFYIISCRIYDTPVLTRLLEDRTTQTDIAQLLSEHELLEKQGEILSQDMLVGRH